MSILKLKDSQGNWISVPTLKGDKGNGIQSAVLNNDYTLTLTFTDGTTYTTPSIRGEKGEQGEPATDMDIHICSASEYDSETRIPTIVNPNDKTFYLVPTEDGTSPDLFTEWVYVNNAWEMFGSAKIDLSDYLTDVQINGTSTVENGVANVPVASSNNLGAVKIGDGLSISSSGTVKTFPADSALARYANNNNRPITPFVQHASTFYGLAKAAGDTTQSQSSNAMGVYTEDAKSSIQNMLGITDKYTPKDWMAESETELVTNAHNIGDLFYIGETLYKVIADLNAGDAINVGVNVEEVNVNDILDDYATKEDVQDNVSIVEKSASGSIASFDDGMDDIPLKKLVVDINPVQDLHGYDSPWVGGGGSNKWDEQWEVGSLNSNTGLPVDSTTLIRSKNFCECSPSTEYAKVCSPTSYVNVFWYDENQAFISLSGGGGSNPYSVITSPSNAKYFKIRTETAYGTTYKNDIAINYPSTATAYSPYENICPISGWTGMQIQRDGRNLWGGSITDSPNGKRLSNYGSSGGYPRLNKHIKPNTYTVSVICNLPSGEAQEDWAQSYQIRAWFKSAIDGKWYEIINTSTGELRASTSFGSAIFAWTSSPNISATPTKIVSKPFKLTIPVSWIALGFYKSGKYLEYTSIQLEVGDTASDIEPYQGRTIPISWQTEAGTVYGGKLDVLSGVMRVERKCIDLSDVEFIRDSAGYFQSRANATIINDGKHFTSGAVASLISSQYIAKAVASVQNNNGSCGMYWYASDNRNILRIRDDRYSDAQSFMSAMVGVQLCYELAEPIEIQLTPHEVNSLLGTNNIFADTGDTEVEYFSQVDQDLIDYIETSLKPYAKEEKLNDYVSDVQVDGTSIVSDGVVEIPIATSESYGVVKVDQFKGICIGANDGILRLSTAGNGAIKTGTDTVLALKPTNQHASTFYGLAKVAGHDEKDSELPVGTYTDEAKTAIKQMLGVHDTIDSFVEEVTGTDVTITGQPSYRYNCGEPYSLTVTPPSSGTIDIRFTSGSTPTVLTLPSTVKMPEWWVEVEANTIYEMCITDGIYCGVMTWAI